MIIGISGKKQSGKNTVANIIEYITNDYNHHGQIVNSYKDFLGVYKGYTNFPKGYIPNWQQKQFAYKLKQIVCLLIGCTIDQLEDNDFKEKELGEEWKRFLVIEQIHDTTVKMYSTWVEAQEYIANREFNTSIWEELRPRDVLIVKEEILTPRKLLQLLGTECGRDIIHPNIWVNGLFSEYKRTNTDEYPPKSGNTLTTVYNPALDSNNEDAFIYPDWLITDPRFLNEADPIKAKGGIMLRVNRPIEDRTTMDMINFRASIPLDTHPSETSLDDYTFDYVIDNNGTIEDLIQKVEIFLKEFKLIT